MTIYLIHWSENDENPEFHHYAFSSYSMAVKVYKKLVEENKTSLTIEEAIEKLDLKKKSDFINLINRL